MIKQAIVVRRDIKMGVGKLATQVAHAAVTSFYKTLKEKPNIAELWIREGQKKVVLKVYSMDELREIYFKALEHGLVSIEVRDAGLTQLEPGTLTAVAIGPDYEDRIDKITGHLKLL